MVAQSEFVRLAVRRANDACPGFQMIWETGVLWSLERHPLDEATPLGDGLHLLETNAWKQEGIPAMRIAYRLTPDGIEIVRLALFPPL